MFRKLLDEGEAGDNVGLLLRGMRQDSDTPRYGYLRSKSRNSAQKFQAGFILSKEEGGRHTPFHNKYRPQFYVRTTDVTGE